MNEQQLAAVKQALEALEIVRPMENPEPAVEEAITALQSIISQDALHKMAEDAVTIGLSYNDWPKIGCVNHDCDKCKVVQEPVAWMRTLFSPELGEFFDYKDGAFANETDSVGWTPLYTTPPAPQPAPLTCKHEWFRTGAMEPGECRCINCGMWNTTAPPAPQPVPVKTYHDGKPWPVAPKPWVGLTDEDIEQGHKESWVDKQAFESAVWWAEKKLKEKNHDQ
jgi:hypothetical protein